MRSKHEAQIIEAEGMLERISRQAEESKADPAWLIAVLTPHQPTSPDIVEIQRYVTTQPLTFGSKVFLE